MTAPRFQKLDATAQPVAATTGHAAVIDGRTGLTWSAGETAEFDHADAQAHIDQLNATAFLGHADWRLPTIGELFGLIGHTRSEPAIDTDAFPNCESDWYWTSTPTAWSPGLAWIVDFNNGAVGDLRRYLTAFVRAVRGVSPAGQ